MPDISFLGAAGTVTGSKHLVTSRGGPKGDERVLVDCGMYQGLKELRDRNWQPFPFDPGSIPFVVLTHAHIDHTGLLPLLVRRGFKGAIVSTPATYELAQLLLMDAAHLQEEDAEYLNRKGLSQHKPALPLFDRNDAEGALKLFTTRPYDEWTEIPDRFAVKFRQAGHLLGSATVEMRITEPAQTTILFSGDLGRYDMPLNPDPEAPPAADYMVLESTYGDRPHPEENLYDQMQALVVQSMKRGGILVIPAFAVGRAQQVIYVLNVLMEKGRIPTLPIHLDSPMAVEATKIYAAHPKEQEATGELTARNVVTHSTVDESKALNSWTGPGILISSSGMLTGGRILHHLKRLLPDPRNTVALVGYQAVGTPGRMLQDHAASIRIHKEDVQVRATIADLCGFSGHADPGEMQRWLGALPRPPKTIFLTHGEPAAAAALAATLQKKGLTVKVPKLGDVADLSA